MTSNSARKQAVRARMAATGTSYTEASRQLGLISTSPPSAYPTLALGQVIRFVENNYRWAVRAVSPDGRYAVLTAGRNYYSILDFQAGVRGPDNSYGTGYGDDEQIADSFARLLAGDTQLSVRHWAWLRYADNQPDPRTAEQLSALRRLAEHAYLAEPRRQNSVYRIPPPLSEGRLPVHSPYDFAAVTDGLALGTGPGNAPVVWRPGQDGDLRLYGPAVATVVALRTLATSAVTRGFSVWVLDDPYQVNWSFLPRAGTTLAVSGAPGEVAEFLDSARAGMSRRSRAVPPMLILIGDVGEATAGEVARSGILTARRPAGVHVTAPARLFRDDAGWGGSSLLTDISVADGATAPCAENRAWFCRPDGQVEVQVWHTSDSVLLRDGLRASRRRRGSEF